MGNLLEIVDSLENRTSKLLHRYNKLKHENASLEEKVKVLRSQQDQYKAEIEKWRETAQSLKMANSMLGSDQYKRDTKLKINALVREIDHCISQLSE